MKPPGCALIKARSTERSLAILDKLASRGSIWPEACAVAIRDLRSSLTRDRTSSQHMHGLQAQSLTKANRTQQSSQEIHLRASSSPSTIMGRSAATHSRSTAHNERPASSGPLNPRDDRIPATPARTYRQSPSNGRRLLYGHMILETDKVAAAVPDQGWSPNSFELATSVRPLLQHSTDYDITANMPVESWSSMQQNYFPINMLQPYPDVSDPFSGFDIPFWMDQDNCATLMRE